MTSKTMQAMEPQCQFFPPCPANRGPYRRRLSAFVPDELSGLWRVLRVFRTLRLVNGGGIL